MQILIIEDDELFIVQLRMMLEKCYNEQEISVDYFKNGEVAKKWLQRHRPNVILLDVVLEDEASGVALAQSIRDLAIPVIFMTAYRRNDLFRNALSVFPANYLQKPFTALELKQAIELAIAKEGAVGRIITDGKDMGSILLSSGQHVFEKISVNTIIAVEAFGNYCNFYRLAASRVTHRMPLKNYPNLLPVEYFIRIHRRYVVNLQLVDRINTKEQLVWSAGLSFPYGSKYRKELFNRFPQ